MALKNEWVNGSEFIMVSPELTKALGGDFVAAGVAARAKYRTNRKGYEFDGLIWWRCSVAELADDMGISIRQVRRALVVLEENGMVEKASHNIEGSWDRTLSYRLIFDS